MKIALSILIGLAVSILRIHAQGSLTPPGPPGPTMLTLSQVEPRTPVDAVHTPSNGANEFAIINSGSFYLTTNIVGVSGKDGIDISANNVTLDLNGFSVLGTNSTTVNYGVQILFNCTNVTVHNGVLSGWSSGIYSLGNNVTLEHLSTSDNGYYGIFVEDVSAIRYCMTSANVSAGIAVAASSCLISDNVSSRDDSGNTGLGGIAVEGNNNRIEDNHITELGGGYGISVDKFGGSVNNIVVRNSVEGNGANDYFIDSLQVAGPIITNTASGIITNSNPWANFAF